jgi:LysM repeat protein
VGISAAFLPTVLSAPQCNDNILSAQTIVDSIVADNSLLLRGGDHAAAVQHLYRKYVGGSKGYNTNLYFGRGDETFYIIKNCWSQENMLSKDSNDLSLYCQQTGASQYLVIMRPYSGNIQVHPLNAAGLMQPALTTRNNTYALTTAKWYRQNNGSWSDDFLYANNQTGSTWSRTLYGSSNEFVGTVAGDWTFSEACAVLCLSQSSAINVVQDFETAYSLKRAVGATPVYNVPGTTADWPTRIYMLYQALSQRNNGHGAFIWYTDEDTQGSYYALEDCYQSPMSEVFRACVSAAYQSRYIAYVMPRADKSAVPTVYLYTPGAPLTQTVTVDKSALLTWNLLEASDYFTSATNPGAWSPTEPTKVNSKCVDTPTKPCLKHQYYTKLIQFAGGPARVGSIRYSTEPCSDGCKVNSNALRLVGQAGGKVDTFSTPISDSATAYSRLEAIAQMFINTNQGSAELFWWCSMDATEFVSISNCYTPDAQTSGFCASTSERYIGFIASKTAFGDGQRRVFAISGAGKLVADGAGVISPIAIDVQTKDFDCKNDYKYYSNATGWGAAGEKLGSFTTTYQKYTRPLYTGLTELGKVGSIRTSRESCYNGCLQNSYAVKATRSVALSANLTKWADISDLTGIEEPIKTLTKAMQDSDQGDSVYLYVGVQKAGTQGDFYGLRNCYALESLAPADPSATWCIQAGTSVKYVAFVRVQKVFGNAMQIYRVWSDGTLGSKIGKDDTQITVSELPFYKFHESGPGGGWMPYSVYETGAMKSSYVVPKYVVPTNGGLAVMTGVIGADHVFYTDQAFCSNTCVTNSYAFPIAFSLYHGWSKMHKLAYSAITTTAAEDALVKVLISALEDNDLGFNVGINYLETCNTGAETCSFYSVLNCRHPDNAAFKWCTEAGPTATYVVTMRNIALYANASYFFTTATIAGSLNKVPMGTEPITTYRTADALSLIAEQSFGLLPGAGGIKTLASGLDKSLIGTGGSYVAPIFPTGSTSNPIGYVAVPISASSPCYDKCQRNSFATKAVRLGAASQIDGGISPLRFDRAEDLPTIKLAVQNVLDVMRSVDYGNNVMMFIGTEDDDFYGVKNCYIAPTLLADTFCKIAVRQGFQYIAYVRNTRYFGDGIRRIYGIRHQPSFQLTGQDKQEVLTKDQYLGIQSGEYKTTQRSWYKLAAASKAGAPRQAGELLDFRSGGWTGLYKFRSGGIGLTYALPFYDTSFKNLRGVVAGDKYGEESCFEPCTRNSYVVPAVRSLVKNGMLDRFAATDSQSTMQQAISELHKAYDANNQGTNKMLYFGMTSDDYYGVKNCRSASTDQDKFCSDPVATARLLAHIKNAAAYNDNKTHVFQISDTGEVNLPAAVGMSQTDYFPTNEPWYTVLTHSDSTGKKLKPGLEKENGWVYQKSYGEFPTPISYSYKVTNTSDPTSDKLIGVAGADRFPSEPCRSQCLYSSYAMSATLDFVTNAPDQLALLSEAKDTKSVGALVKMLWQSFQSSDHGDNVQLMYTVDKTGDFYAIKNCWLPGNYNDFFCQKAGKDSAGRLTVWTIAMVRNLAVFGTLDVQVFAIDRKAGGMVTNPTGQIISMTDDKLGEAKVTAAFPTDQVLSEKFLNFKLSNMSDMKSAQWYAQQSGWDKVYDLADNSVGQTYSVPVTVPVTANSVTTQSQIGIVSAIRTEQEECFSGDDQDVPSIRVRVRTLDTVETIAKEYGYSWTELLLMNPLLKNPNDLKPKTYLYNALLYVVRQDDTLYSIATKYGISWKELADMNPQIPQIKARLAWVERQSGDPGGFPYYYNLQTRQAQWEKPPEIIEAEKTDLKIYRGQKLAVRPNLEALVCQNKYYSAKATLGFSG